MSEYIREDQERRRREDLRRKDREREDRDLRTREMPQRREDRDEIESMMRLADVVNDPLIEIDTAMMKSINDPAQVMMPTGEVAKITRAMAPPRGRNSPFQSQFASKGIPLKPRKRSKKNPKLGLAFEKANQLGRKKKGGFKKGWSQSRIASTAHRLVRQGRV